MSESNLMLPFTVIWDPWHEQQHGRLGRGQWVGSAMYLFISM